MLGKLAVVALIALTLFVGAVRPLTRPSGPLNRPLGLTRWSLLSESGINEKTPLPSPAEAPALVFTAPLVSVLLVLKTRRAAFRPVPVRRLKFFARNPVDSLLSD